MGKLREAQQRSPVHTEMDDKGWHRIVSFDDVGEWAMYENIATLRTHGDLLIAVTEYFAGELEAEVVYSVKPVFAP